MKICNVHLYFYQISWRTNLLFCFDKNHEWFSSMIFTFILIFQKKQIDGIALSFVVKWRIINFQCCRKIRFFKYRGRSKSIRWVPSGGHANGRIMCVNTFVCLANHAVEYSWIKSHSAERKILSNTPSVGCFFLRTVNSAVREVLRKQCTYVQLNQTRLFRFNDYDSIG